MRPPRPPWLVPPLPMLTMLDPDPVGGRTPPTVTGGSVPWVLMTTGVVMICRHASIGVKTCSYRKAYVTPRHAAT